MTRIGLLIAFVALAAATSPAQSAPRRGVDLSDPAQRLEAYVRANGDTSGREVATYGEGTVYAVVPGERARPLFNIEVVGMSRYERTTDGYQRLHREVGYYTDRATGEILTRWFNPYLQREVEVIPIQNDPVNRKFTVAEAAAFKLTELGDDVALYREVPLRYPNPLNRAGYPQYSSGDFYEAMEMFNTFVKRADLDNPKLTSLPSTGSWARIGPWLPWMEMGQHVGYLAYHSRSFKPRDGIAGLPARLREHIARHHEKFLHAPQAYVTPDETSWTWFKKVIDERRKQGPNAAQ